MQIIELYLRHSSKFYDGDIYIVSDGNRSWMGEYWTALFIETINILKESYNRGIYEY